MAIHHCISDIEGQRGFFQILLLINERIEVLQRDLYNRSHISISNNVTAVRAIKLLLKYELISEIRKDGTNGKYYRLTKKGKKCARALIEFQKIIAHK